MASLIMKRGYDNQNYRPTGQLPPPFPRTDIALHQDIPSQSHGPPMNPHVSSSGEYFLNHCNPANYSTLKC